MWTQLILEFELPNLFRFNSPFDCHQKLQSVSSHIDLQLCLLFKEYSMSTITVNIPLLQVLDKFQLWSYIQSF